MSRRSRFAGEVALVAGSQVLGQLAGLARNIFIARLLGPADMGIAAMLGLAMTLLEMISDLAPEEILVTDAQADDPALQATLHALRIIRCGVIALLFVALSPFITQWFGLPHDATTVGLCAAVLMVRGFGHSDVDRAIRQRRFRPYALTQLLPNLICLLMLAPVASVVSNYRAVLVMLLIHAISATLISHWMSTRRYRVGCDPQWLPQLWRFGAPILFNGLLLFATLQGDRFIVGTFYSQTDVGVFAVTLGFALVPALLLARVNATLLLPRLVSMRRTDAMLARRWGQAFAMVSAMCLVTALGFALIGPWLIPTVYGTAFESGAAIIGPIGLAQALFVLRDSTGIVAMACGDTKQPIPGNVVRLLTLPAIAVTAWQSAPLVWIAWLLVGSELLSLLISSGRLTRRHRLPLIDTLLPIIGIAASGIGANIQSTAPLASTMLIGTGLTFCGMTAFRVLQLSARLSSATVVNCAPG